eukprot:TRINITY_DN22262_c0_g1_i5.p1 TRINITY_DN22262_c0_g1~~TRINITY_DN22262_c0_g1_i5.p1  ORF type:complete len:225 (-),score=26.25 TRINITY_DN22262_c0_g1_i5:176-850(-)
MLEVNAHTWDGASPPPDLRKGSYDVQIHHIMDGLPTVPVIESDDEEEDPNPFPEAIPRHDSKEKAAARDKFVGIVLSLVAGGLFAIMFAPMPLWQARMEAAGLKPVPFDFVFAVCVGCALTSTVWLTFWSSVKRYNKKPLDKSVLRPALAAGAIYYMALMLEYYALAQLPYAVAYTTCTGLALAASMGWAILAFDEMKGPHNRLMAALSFAGVFIGAVLLALAA